MCAASILLVLSLLLMISRLADPVFAKTSCTARPSRFQDRDRVMFAALTLPHRGLLPQCWLRNRYDQ